MQQTNDEERGEDDDCQNPNCMSIGGKNKRRSAEETYEDENGNEIRVCEECYYKLVTRKRPVTINKTVNPPSITDTSGNRSLFEKTMSRSIDPNVNPESELSGPILESGNRYEDQIHGD